MIITFFLGLVFIFINFILNALPTGGTLPTGFTSSISQIFTWIRSFDFIFPLSAISICLPIAFAWILFVFSWDFIHWVFRKIPALNIK